MDSENPPPPPQQIQSKLEQLRCPRCQEVLIHPTTLHPCTHTLCQLCITNEVKCPICQEDIDQVEMRKGLEKEIDGLYDQLGEEIRQQRLELKGRRYEMEMEVKRRDQEEGDNEEDEGVVQQMILIQQQPLFSQEMMTNYYYPYYYHQGCSGSCHHHEDHYQHYCGGGCSSSNGVIQEEELDPIIPMPIITFGYQDQEDQNSSLHHHHCLNTDDPSQVTSCPYHNQSNQQQHPCQSSSIPITHQQQNDLADLQDPSFLQFLQTFDQMGLVNPMEDKR